MKIFDKKNSAVNAIFEFVEEAMEMGESCLIHSIHGKSRATAVLVAYLMRKYGWSLNKCLELTNSKKEGLEIRNNYLRQMQELEKRFMEGKQLSTSWSDAKNEEDLLLANTFLNSKKAESLGPAMKKTGRKKVSWDEKLVNKQSVNMSSTMTRFKEMQQPPPPKKVGPVKSILKGCPNPCEDEGEAYTPVKKEFKLDESDKMVNNINGNIVHVTVNNFITTEKKPSIGSKLYNARPFSSDTKDREKKTGFDAKTNKMFGYDTFSSNLKSAYEQKMLGSKPIPGTAATVSKPGRKKEETRGFVPNERPSSANQSDEIKRQKPLPFTTILGREEMMVTGSSGVGGIGSVGLAGKRRLPSGPANSKYR
jgi:hypothetical protein